MHQKTRTKSGAPTCRSRMNPLARPALPNVARPATARAGGDVQELDVDELDQLLRGELSAIDTYRQALDRNRDQYGGDARFAELEQMLRDHEQAAAQLRNMIRSMGGTELDDSGAWGTWANTVMGTAKLFGDKAALKALKEGEESGIKDYRMYSTTTRRRSRSKAHLCQSWTKSGSTSNSSTV